jgi:hypothetical protein
MVNKLYSILIIGVSIILSLSMFSTTTESIISKNESYKITNFRTYDKNNVTEFWAVLVGSDPFNDNHGKDVIRDMKETKNILC